MLIERVVRARLREQSCDVLSPAQLGELIRTARIVQARGVDGEQYPAREDGDGREEDHEQADEPQEHVRVHPILAQLPANEQRSAAPSRPRIRTTSPVGIAAMASSHFHHPLGRFTARLLRR